MDLLVTRIMHSGGSMALSGDREQVVSTIADADALAIDGSIEVVGDRKSDVA